MSLICRGVEVKIISEGEGLPFYDVQDQFDKTTAYIASVAGQTFKFNILSRTNASATCHIDGRCMQHTVVRANSITLLEGPAVGNLLQRYRFSTLSTIDSDTVDANSQPDLQKLGTIELKIRRLSEIGEPHDDPRLSASTQTKDIGAVSERSKKNGWHVVSLDEAVKTIGSQRYTNATYIDSQENPYAVFVIKYQPSILLRAKGIIKEPITQESGSSNPGSAFTVSEDLSNNVSKRRNSPQADADAPNSKRRKHLQPEGSSRDATAELRTASRNVAGTVGVKREPNEDSREQGERIQSLENALKVSQDALRSIQSELDRLKSLKSTAPQNACKNERASPISLGSDDGDIIDLTLED